MTTTHTPGPWKDGPVFGKEGRALFFTDESKPGKWQRRLDDKAGVFTEGDARLIAAAPDLLAELKFAVEVLEGIPGAIDADVIRDLRAAIAKATES